MDRNQASQLRAQGILGESCDMPALCIPSLSISYPVSTESVLFTATPFHTQLRIKARRPTSLPLLLQP